MMADQHMLVDASRISVTPALLVSHRANSNPDIRSEIPACHPAEKPEKSSISKGLSGSVALLDAHFWHFGLLFPASTTTQSLHPASRCDLEAECAG